MARKQSGGRQRLRKRGTAVGVNQEPYLIAHRNRLHLDYAGAAGAHGLQGRGGAARSGTVGGMRGEDLAQPTTSPGPPALTLCATAILPRKRAPCSLVAAGAAIDDMAAMDDMAVLGAGFQCRLMLRRAPMVDRRRRTWYGWVGAQVALQWQVQGGSALVPMRLGDALHGFMA